MLAVSLEGCANIQHSYHIDRVPMGERTSSRPSEKWQHDVAWTQEVGPSGSTLLSGHATKHRDCIVTTIHREEVTQVHVRRNPAPGLTAGFAVIGAIGAGFMIWGLNEYQQGEPLVQRRPGEGDVTTTTGHAVFWGGAASLLLPIAVIDGLRSIDTSDSEEAERRDVTTRPCEQQLATDVALVLNVGGQFLAEAKTDAQGRVQVEIPLEKADHITAPIDVIVDGIPLREGIDHLQHLVPSPFPLARAADRVEFVGVSLKGAHLGELGVALSHHGAALTEPRQNKQAFSSTGRHWLGVSELVVFYDGDQRFVGAVLSGRIQGTDHVQLLRLLEHGWGKPELREGEGKRDYLWDLGNALQARYTVEVGSDGDPSAEIGVRLVLRDLEAEARVRSVLEADE